MQKHSYIFTIKLVFFVVTSLSVVGCAGGGALNPSHFAKYTFKGKITDSSGRPVPNATIKVLEWETISNHQGEWSMQHVVGCGALRDNAWGVEKTDAALIVADGYAPEEISFVVKHPGWFKGCEREEELVIKDVVLKPSSQQSMPMPEVKSSKKPKIGASRETTI